MSLYFLKYSRHSSNSTVHYIRHNLPNIWQCLIVRRKDFQSITDVQTMKNNFFFSLKVSVSVFSEQDMSRILIPHSVTLEYWKDELVQRVLAADASPTSSHQQRTVPNLWHISLVPVVSGKILDYQSPFAYIIHRLTRIRTYTYTYTDTGALARVHGIPADWLALFLSPSPCPRGITR